jgi:hypothetical protein
VVVVRNCLPCITATRTCLLIVVQNGAAARQRRLSSVLDAEKRQELARLARHGRKKW